MSAPEFAEWGLSGGLLGFISWTFVRALLDGERRAQLRLRARLRAPRGRRAATEASLDDPAFSPERIEAAVTGLLDRAEQIWRRGGNEAGGALIALWARDRQRRLNRGLRLAGKPRVDIIRVVNRGHESEDRVVVRVRCVIDRGISAVPRLERKVHLDERWTLTRVGEDWKLGSVSGDPVAEGLLSAPQIASPSADTARLQEVSLRELSQDDGSPAGLFDASAPADAQLRDLAVADDRFSPLLIEATLNHIVEAWEEAAEGADAPLLAVATGKGAHALLFGDRGWRRYVQDARLERWRVVRLDGESQPPAVVLAVRVKATTATGTRRALELSWTLALGRDRSGAPEWRLADSDDAPPR